MTEKVPLGFLGLAGQRGTHICSFNRGGPGRVIANHAQVHENPYYIEPGKFLARQG